MRPILRSTLRIGGEYALAVLLCLLILIWVMRLWQGDLRVPFTYFGDAVWTSLAIKGTIEHGWWWFNPSLGAPAGLNFGAFPAMDNTQFLIIKAISLITGNYALTLNLFYLLTFPLTTVTSLYVFRKLNFSYAAALAGSLLYTFLPYHFFRSYHLHMASYYLLPLMVLVVLWVLAGDLNMFRPRAKGRWPKLHFGFKTIFALAVCILVGGCGIYYPFFSCFFLLLAGVIGSLQTRRIHHLLSALVLMAVISGAVLISMTPLLLYQRTHGKASMGARSVADAEVMGLKVGQLLLPIGGHRIPRLAALRARYNAGPLTNENDTSSLGFIGAIGFLWLLVRLFYQKPASPLLDHVSWLNIFGLLYGTIGGFAALFSLLISPQIRAPNRISAFIAFFSLLAAMFLVDRGYKWLERHKKHILGAVLVSVLTVIGVLDQTTTTFFFIPEYKKIEVEYRSDAEFVSRIESSLPNGAMVFQLPYMTFPENGPLHRITQDFELVKPYLHSTKLRWSYGAINADYYDTWQRAVVVKPVPEFIDEIVANGFSGLYINRNGYADSAVSLEAELKTLLGAGPITNSDGTLLFFSLANYSSQKK
ncbi:MAG TPA: hypothetical protein VFT44_06800 [Pyrinomonadaceae bacterium]|nr:hypothetical protein [Pyrinomonadaceae bacterium]